MSSDLKHRVAALSRVGYTRTDVDAPFSELLGLKKHRACLPGTSKFAPFQLRSMQKILVGHWKLRPGNQVQEAGGELAVSS